MCGISIKNSNTCIGSDWSLRRGKDSCGESFYGHYNFTHARLQITDTFTAGRQPKEDSSFIFLFNGEIYNWSEISRNESINATGDTDLLWKALKKNRLKEVLEVAFGPYAIAWYEKKNNILYFTRDLLGEKPLYYKSENNKFLGLSSTIRDFYKDENPISWNAVGEYLTFGFSISQSTIYQNIHAAEPGAIYKVEQSVLKKIQKLISKRNAFSISSLRSNINHISKYNGPTVLFLSNGIDSNFIKQNQKFDIIVSLDVDGKCKTSNKLIELYSPTKKELLLAFDEYFSSQEVPNGDLAGFSIHLLTKYISGRSKVAITGDGADEIFGSYPKNNLSNLLPNCMKSVVYAFMSSLSSCFCAHCYRVIVNQLFNSPEYTFDSRFRLQRYLTVKTDANSLKNGVEIRSPFMDSGFFTNKSLNKTFAKNRPRKKLLIENMNMKSISRVKHGFGSYKIFSEYLRKNSHYNDKINLIFRNSKVYVKNEIVFYRALMLCKFV